MTSPPVIFWFRRDLRLHDNAALNAALESGAPVLPVFVFDPAILRSERTGAPRVAFVLAALRELDAALRARGSGLVVRHGTPAEVLRMLVGAKHVQALYFNRDYTPYARHRDASVEKAVPVPTYGFDELLLVPPGDVLKGDGDPYKVFTPFKRKWLGVPKALPVNTAAGIFHDLANVTNFGLPPLRMLDFGATIDLPEVGEAIARQRLADFVAGPIYDYETGRDRLAAVPHRGTSFLSPYLRFGMLSIREAYHAAQAARAQAKSEAARKSIDIWIGELCWRDFFTHILYHFPRVKSQNFYDTLAWRNAPAEFEAWRKGRTGYPVVDAAMRQLVQIGWMPNRARMIVASFLTKDLLIDWRHGERYFMQWLIDGDTAANNGGWQWVAGTGAQPYFRIFNPVLQSNKFDPKGIYIRRWVPELREVSDEHIHAPWKMASPPVDYPRPLVDHKMARARALDAYEAARAKR